MKKSFLVILTLALLAVPVLAAAEDTDYSSYSTEELAAMRGTLRDATVEERTVFQTEWQSRVLEMDEATRMEYAGRPDNALADGTGVHRRLGRSSEAGMPAAGVAGVADGSMANIGNAGSIGHMNDGSGGPQAGRGMRAGSGGNR